MGADFSKGEAARFGSLFLQTDKSTYFGGDTVTGKVYLSLTMPYPGNQLFLKLKGVEYSSFLQVKSEVQTVKENGMDITKHVDVDYLYDEKHEIIKMRVPMYTWSVLLPGQYTIPFAFMLPQTLPSTFHQEGHKFLANISYKIEAVLEPSLKGSPKLKYKQPFVVRQPIKSAMQGVGNEVKTNLTACCSGKGTNVLRAKFEKNFYAPGETAQVVMQLDNTESQIANQNIAFTLKQKVTMKAKGKEETKTCTKVSRTLPGIPAGGASDSNFIAINLPSFQNVDFTTIKTLDWKQHLLSLKDNNEVLNSATKGKLITSEYFLEVSCPMEGCCAPIPTISCPIEIYYPEIQLKQVTAPPNWAPQEIGIVNLSFNGSSVVNTGSVSLNVNVDPLAMAANTMMAAGNIMANAAMNSGMNAHVSMEPHGTIHHNNNVTMEINHHQQPASNVTWEINGNQQPKGNVTFEVNGVQQPASNVTWEINGNQQQNAHVSFEVNGVQQPASNVTWEINGNQQPANMMGGPNVQFTMNATGNAQHDGFHSNVTFH